MLGFTDAPRAWWLTRAMARLTGVSLPQAVVEGWLSRGELSQIVSRCESCAQPARCNAFMERRADEHAMPAFCPNKAAIEALAIV
jgi:hypothetical protein